MRVGKAQSESHAALVFLAPRKYGHMTLTHESLSAQAFAARIALDAAQAARLLPELNAMLASFAVLEQVNTENVQPLCHVLNLQNIMREDEAKQSFTREQLLANAPMRTDEAFVVPKTVD